MAARKRKMNRVSVLQRNRVVNSLVKTPLIHRLADFGSNQHPLKRKTVRGFTYHAESTASLVAAKEIFGVDTYARELISKAPNRSFSAAMRTS
jgi:hypothetical protein